MKKTFGFRFILFALAAGTLLLSGCLDDANPPGPDTEVHMEIASFAAIGETVNGVRVSSIRIIAINESNASVAFNASAPGGGLVFEPNATLDDDTFGDYKLTLRKGTYTFYAILNEASLGEGAAALAALNASNDESDLAAIRVPATTATLTEASMVCVGSVGGVVIEDTDEDGIADIESLKISAERIAAKLDVNIRKTTSDQVTLNSASLSHAAYANLIATRYDGELIAEPLTGGAIALTGTYVKLAEAYILPEHILGESDPTSLTLNATHASGVFSSTDSHTVPLLGNSTELHVKRNSVYEVNITYESNGDYGATPYVTYSVADWNQVGGGSVDIGGVIAVENSWVVGTLFEPGSNNNTVLVGTNGWVTMRFGLHNPAGAQWRASLSNPQDFEFVGVSEGIARQNSYEITIRPKDDFDSDDIFTELSIRINPTGDPDGWEEWDLNRENPGRYIIKYSQIL
jgi:hypothetical protein